MEHFWDFRHFDVGHLEIRDQFWEFLSCSHGFIHSSCHFDRGAGDEFRHSCLEHGLHAFDHSNDLILVLHLRLLWQGLLTRSLHEWLRDEVTHGFGTAEDVAGTATTGSIEVILLLVVADGLSE